MTRVWVVSLSDGSETKTFLQLEHAMVEVYKLAKLYGEASVRVSNDD